MALLRLVLLQLLHAAVGHGRALDRRSDVLMPSADLCASRSISHGLRTLCDKFSFWEPAATLELQDELGTLTQMLEREGKEAPDGPFKLPSLESCGVSSYDALEPSIDKETMKFHHDFHHQKYVDKLNENLEEFPQYKDLKLEDILSKVKADEAPIRNMAGGHYNHALFWSTLKKGGKDKPCGELKDAIVKQWGSLDDFKTEFNETAEKLFGSGWVWLSVTDKGKLVIQSLPGQDSPIMGGGIQSAPILGLDVWEHAYYLKYQNRRPEYITAWWDIIDWETVGNYYKLAVKSKKPLPFDSLCAAKATEAAAEKPKEAQQQPQQPQQSQQAKKRHAMVDGLKAIWNVLLYVS